MRLRTDRSGARVWVSNQDGAAPVLKELDDGLLELELTAGSTWRISAEKQVDG
jgi:hypothetical protein